MNMITLAIGKIIKLYYGVKFFIKSREFFIFIEQLIKEIKAIHKVKNYFDVSPQKISNIMIIWMKQMNESLSEVPKQSVC